MRFTFLAFVCYVDGVFLPLYAIHKPLCFLTRSAENSKAISGSYEISGTTEGMDNHM